MVAVYPGRHVGQASGEQVAVQVHAAHWVPELVTTSVEPGGQRVVGQENVLGQLVVVMEGVVVVGVGVTVEAAWHSLRSKVKVRR